MSIEEKFNIIYKGKERFYKYSLTDNRRKDMENTRPEEAFIDGVKYTDNSWGGLLVIAVNYIIKKNYLTKEQLLGFNVHWYNKTLFSEIQLTNFRELDNGLFINTNLGSLRSYWFLCDIIYYASIQLNDCYIIVKRFGIAEPKEVQEYVINNNLCLYHKHLALKFNDDKTIERYERNIKVLDKYVSENTSTTKSLFLIDNKVLLARTKSDLLKLLKKTLVSNQYSFAESILEDYCDFAKSELV